MADIGCGAKCAKLMILFINLLFGLIGIVLLGLGIFLVIDAKALHKEYLIPAGSSAQLILISAGVILIVGLIIVLITIVGCCAALKEHTGCLTFYSCILILVLVLQIIAVILAGVFYNQIMDSLGDEMLNTVTYKYGQPEQNDSTNFIDNIQKDLDCCGITNNGPTDWRLSKWNNDTQLKVPESCCTVDTNGKYVNVDKCRALAYNQNNTERAKYVYTEGCESKVDGLLKKYVGILIGVVIGVIVLQVVFIVVACLLKSSVARGYEYV